MPERDRSLDAERPGAERFTVPRSTFIWLILFLLACALPSISPAAPRRFAARGGDTLTAAAFEKYVAAELEVRSAFGLSAVQAMGGLPQTDYEGDRRKLLREAAQQYRALLDDSASPDLPRRLLLLEQALGRPLDNNLLVRDLRPALRAAGRSRAEIEAEDKLWRALYGPKRVAPPEVAGGERRIRAMRLRFLQDRALYSLYRAAGDQKRAEAYARRLESAATRSLGGSLVMGLLVLLGFVAGLVFLVLFLLSAVDKRWQRVARVATQPQRLGWGDLLDAFAFYLFLMRGVGLAAGAVIGRLIAAPTTREELAVSAVLQIGTGAAAGAYLQAKARRRGAALSEIGLSARGALRANIGYGIAGYCATLPLVLALRKIAELIFRHIPNTAPNPIMPLIVSERGLAGRLVMFVMVAVAAPFFEELFFRGALFAGLRSRWGWVVSALLSSAVFAIAHPPQDWLPIFGLGFGFATMREMRQSLVPSMTAHLIQNTVTFFFLSSLFDTT